jgi:hypothetical protein
MRWISIVECARAAMILAMTWSIAGPALAQMSPNRLRPYMDSRAPMFRTQETRGYGALADGATPSGWLLCREGEVLVGVSARKGRLIDRVQIHCAAVFPAGQQRLAPFGFYAFGWSRAAMHPPDVGNYPDATAGGGGGQFQGSFICPPGFAISGMAGVVNGGQLADLTFECARLLGSASVIPALGGVDWFTERCQPSLAFAIFPADFCHTPRTTQQVNLERMRSGGSDWRSWLRPQFGVVWTHQAGDDQRCVQYGAVGLTFIEETVMPSFAKVVSSLRLVCISHPPIWMRPSLPNRR